MREIEIKARISNPTKLQETLKLKGIHLSKAVKQHDVVYCILGSADNALDANWLRIRTENDEKVIFTLKRSVVGHLDSIEHEVMVDSAEELEAIIKLLGFEPYSDLTKIRQKAQTGSLEICVDIVPGLGDFIEVEKMMDKDANHDTVVNELWKFLNTLGIEKNAEEHLGYDVLERKKRWL